MVGQFANSIDQNMPLGGATFANRNYTFTHWKHLSLLEIQTALSETLGTGVPSGQTTPANNAQRVYVTDLTRKHRWRNTLGGGEMEMQFYQLIPRDHMPAVFGGTGGAMTITPSVTTAYGVGGALANPTMYTQAFTDEAIANGGGAKVPFENTAATPFMSPLMTSMFKIKPMVVQGPNGKGSLIKLQPGEECSYTGRYNGPHMVSANKYLLSGLATSTVGSIWEFRKGMPIIFIQARGSVSHDANGKTNVGLGPTGLDYFQDFRFRLWAPTPINKTTSFITSALPNYGGPSTQSATMDEVDIVNATDTNIVIN